MIAKYAVGVRFVLRHQTATLLVTEATFALTVYLYLIGAEGFSGAGYGRSAGDYGAPQTISFAAMGAAAAGAGEDHPEDPDVESVSSFIGSTTPTRL